MIRLVFLEDDMLVGPLVTRTLQEKGFEVTFINNLDVLRNVLRDIQPHVLLLDLELGSRNSLEEIPAIRQEFPNLPIIIASSHHDSKEMASCYEAGAKYYLLKPYEADEVERLIRLSVPQKVHDCIYIGEFRLDTVRRMLIYLNEDSVLLNPKEYLLLKFLWIHKGDTVTRQQILREIWQNEEAGGSLNNYIVRLREYLKRDLSIQLVTVKGVGYSLVD